MRVVEKAWRDSHLFGLLVMLLYLEVALGLLLAFGASHDQDIDWAFKQFVSFIPIFSSAMHHTAPLNCPQVFGQLCGCLQHCHNWAGHVRRLPHPVQFQNALQSRLLCCRICPECVSRGLLANALALQPPHFRPGRPFSSNVMFESMLRVLVVSSAVVGSVAAVAYYFGSGRNFREYVQRYTDEVHALAILSCSLHSFLPATNHARRLPTCAPSPALQICSHFHLHFQPLPAPSRSRLQISKS